MCDTCGCENDKSVKIYLPEKEHQPEHHQDGHHHHHDHHNHTQRDVAVEQDVLAKNNLFAERNRGYFEALKILSLNMVSSPGSGKTTVLEKTILAMGEQLNMYVIEGDQQTANDARRIQKAGGRAIQVNTGNGCHLDAQMVNDAAKKLDLQSHSILFIENVGNLVCPSLFDLGEQKRVAIFSVTEGDDKPEKYPTIFHTSDVCIINKTDLLPYVDFNMEKAKKVAKQLNPDMIFFEVSAKTEEGMEKWYEWLKNNS